MKFLNIVIIFIILCGSFSYAEENNLQPKLPYYNLGACPFECCVYGLWTSRENVIAYKNKEDKSKIAFTIQKGEQVTALEGFVVSYKAGITKVIKPIQMGYLYEGQDREVKLNLKPGDIIYTLHYLGEGFDLFWYKGKLYSDQIHSDKPDPVPSPSYLLLQTISVPVTDWWVKIKNSKGQIGWIINPPYFDGSDACSWKLT